MFKAAFALALLSCIPLPATEPTQTVTFNRSFGSAALPTFDRGYLLFLHNSNAIEVWGPDGQLAFETQVINPPQAVVMSAAVDGRGAFALGVADISAGGVAFLDRSGKQVRFIETGQYLPSHVCFDADNNLWTFGWQRDRAQNGREDPEDYPLFRKYSPDGKQIGAFISRSLFPRPGLSPGSPSGGFLRLRISGNRIGALAYAGKRSETREWIELALDGSLIGHWKIGREGSGSGGMAFTSSNALCRERFESSVPHAECFDRETKAWKPVGNVALTEDNGRSLGILLGADGDDLIFGSSGGNIRLSRVQITLP